MAEVKKALNTAARFVVEAIHCNCHPETCCCSDARLRMDGESISAGSFESMQKLADKLASALHMAAQPEVDARIPSIDELTPLLGTEDAAFSAWRNSVPDKHWAKLDLSALRIGYELGKRVAPVGQPAARALNDAALKRALNAQPYVARNSAIRVWQLFLDEGHAEEAMRAALNAANTSD